MWVFLNALAVLVRKGRYDLPPHPIHFSFLILGEWAGENVLSLVLSWENQELGYHSRVPLCTWHMINYWISFPTFLPRWWCAHPQGPSPRHLWLASLAVFFPIIGDCASMPSISPGQGLRFMEGKFSLTQFSPCEWEERMGLINVLPHYGQGHPTHSCRPVLGAHGPLPSALSHTSDRVRHQWTQLPFHVFLVILLCRIYCLLRRLERKKNM